MSPYLRAHASNPVDWFEWGEEAFTEARRRDVPVFLSVGYAACHWCHVMAHESFEDPDIAAQLNRDFVSIKVDREERPDIDAVYMAATTALTGHGGWPMSVWLDLDRLAFHAGTYFPPTQGRGMPSFPQVLAGVTDAWRTRRADVGRAAVRINELLAETESLPGEAAPQAPMQVMAGAVAGLAEQFDPVRAGFGGAPKFPPAMTLEFLLRFHALTGDEQALVMVSRTCEAMARGGINDQLEGGFARYSVDAGWVVPHFEKMLVDNALLVLVYTHWWAAAEDPLARRVVTETVEFLLGRMQTEHGGFAAALDADSVPAGAQHQAGPAVEGAAYVWSVPELAEAVGADDAAWAAEVLHVTAGGTFERGRSTLQLPRDPGDPERWLSVRRRLADARRRRPQPTRDDKSVAAWNALTITALVEAGEVFDRPDWISSAVRAGTLLRDVHIVGDRLMRVSRDGRVGMADGVLEDYGLVIEAFLRLQAATGDERWYQVTVGLGDAMIARFSDGEAGFFDTASDAEQLVRRPRDPADNASPSGTSAAVSALVQLAAVTGRADLRERAGRTLAALAPLQSQHPRFAGWSLAAAAAAFDGPREVAVVGDPADDLTRLLLRAAFAAGAPGAAVVLGPGGGSAVVPLLQDRSPVHGAAAAYVCRDFVCELPTSDPEALRQQLRGRSARW